jgi:hypothetical protein
MPTSLLTLIGKNLSEEDKEDVLRAWSALDADRKEQLRQQVKAATTKEEKVAPEQQA